MASISELEKRTERARRRALEREAAYGNFEGAHGQRSGLGSDGHIVASIDSLHRKLDKQGRTFKILGVLAILALVTIGLKNKDTVVEKADEIFGGGRPTSVEVPSNIPLVDSTGNQIAGAISYKLSTKTQTKQLGDHSGKALLVDVSIQTTDEYANSTFAKNPQICMPESLEAIEKGCQPMSPDNACVSSVTATDVYCLPPGELSADATSIRFGLLAGTENDWLCRGDIFELVTKIKENPEDFDNETFSAAEIASASTVHATMYAPYTDTPLPPIRNEILFVIPADIKLTC